MPDRPNLLLLTAIETEAGGIEAAMEWFKGPYPRRIEWNGWPIAWHRIGMRGCGLAAVDVPTQCKLIILAGLSGGLDPALRVGDVIVSEAPAWLKIPEGLLQRPTVSTENAVTSVAAKAELFARTNAAAVDMETSIVRAWASAKGIDFVSIRTISDTSDDAIDPKVMNLVNVHGRARPTHVGSYILGNPLRIRQLMKLGRNSKRAARNLGIVVRQIIELLPPASRSGG